MKLARHNLTKLALVAAVCFVSSAARAEGLSDVTQRTMEEVVRLARGIRALSPRLDDKKYVEYALGVHRAAQRFGLDPHLLIAIAHQETGFREKLPEGAAGEIGMLQIRKNWLKHKKFSQDLNNPTLAEMHSPAKSFLMAAWLLKDLQINVKEKGIPFWAYYNAMQVDNRFKYFLLVNRHLSVLKKAEAVASAASRVAARAEERELASAPSAAPTPVRIAAEPYNWRSEPFGTRTMQD